MRLVVEQLDRFEAFHVMFNQRHFADVDIKFEMSDGRNLRENSLRWQRIFTESV